MIYWGERAIEGTKDEDSGANGDDGMTFLQTKGVCPETTWPYDPTRFAEKPPVRAWAEATQHKIGDPITIDNTNLNEIKSCLASGYPIAFGFIVYSDLESDKVAATGLLPMPTKGEESIGGHEVLMVGYDDATRHFKVRNSWGPGWGIQGYFLMPYAYATNPDFAGDFRSARLVS
jgi:C1A family cysteine protease